MLLIIISLAKLMQLGKGKEKILCGHKTDSEKGNVLSGKTQWAGEQGLRYGPHTVIPLLQELREAETIPAEKWENERELRDPGPLPLLNSCLGVRFQLLAQAVSQPYGPFLKTVISPMKSIFLSHLIHLGKSLYAHLEKAQEKGPRNIRKVENIL